MITTYAKKRCFWYTYVFFATSTPTSTSTDHPFWKLLWWLTTHFENRYDDWLPTGHFWGSEYDIIYGWAPEGDPPPQTPPAGGSTPRPPTYTFTEVKGRPWLQTSFFLHCSIVVVLSRQQAGGIINGNEGYNGCWWFFQLLVPLFFLCYAILQRDRALPCDDEELHNVYNMLHLHPASYDK